MNFEPDHNDHDGDPYRLVDPGESSNESASTPAAHPLQTTLVVEQLIVPVIVPKYGLLANSRSRCRMMHMSENGATLPLLKTVFESILEVFILCFAGWILAIRGLLDKKTQKKLNILNINLFTPALLFSKVAFFLTPSKLKELWVIPFIFVV
ncbi:hypothetical protein FRC20_008480, partial [Serendipita sp. 405]